MIKKRIQTLLFCLVMLFIPRGLVHASHIFGGDIVYRCLPNNRFEFTFTLFQDCLDGDQQAIQADNPSYWAIFNQVTGALVANGQTGNFVSQTTVPTGFSNDCINNMPNVCLLKTVFRFNVTLPPSNDGYIFVYQRCCRNQAINNIYSPGVTGATFTIDIPPFTNNTCTNNSAVFNFDPPQIICVNNPLEFNFSASDPDGDSLTYTLCEARIGGDVQSPIPGAPGNNPVESPPYLPVTYISPLSATYPIPSNPAFSINSQTGMLSGTPTMAGRYVFTVCVTEWRNGVVINKISRDLQFVVTNCSKAVIANIPSRTHEPDVYMALCDSTFTINFENTSEGTFSYFWNFGDPTTLADTSHAQFPTWTYPDTGTYDVHLIVNRGSTCPDSITKKVKIYPKFEVDFDILGKLCKGEPIQFIDQSQATFPSVFGWEWNFGDGQTSTDQNPIHVFGGNTENFQIQLIAKTTRGCIDTLKKSFTIPHFKPFAGYDTTVVIHDPFTMNGSGGITYLWTPSDYLTNPLDPKSAITIPEPGIYGYKLAVTSAQGCEGSDSVRITVADRKYFIVPSAFSPNGDGRNDVLKPLSAGFSGLTYFKVYNRYGQLVYDMYRSTSGGWDGTFRGKEADMGVYFWHARATNKEGQEESFEGDVTLIR